MILEKRKSGLVGREKRFFFLIILLALCFSSFAQEPPPIPLTITPTAQTMSFGAFTMGAAGGTITINPDGSRSSSGDVIQLNLGYSYTPALFELLANPGTMVTLLLGAPSTLTGSGGGTMSLQLTTTLPLTPYVMSTTPPATTLMYVGGVLTVQNIGLNPAGTYTGTYNITFVQE